MYKSQATVLLSSQDFYSKVGDEGILLEFTNTTSGKIEWKFVPIADAPNGIGGNMDHEVKRFHGWRGTTNNVSCYAKGVRKIKKIIGEADEYGNCIKVLLGKDLHQDWE